MDGIKIVNENGWYNFLNEDGNTITNENFLFASPFVGGKALVKRENGLWNYLKPDGTFVSKDRDFEAADQFIGPVGSVYYDEKWHKIDIEGVITEY